MTTVPMPLMRTLIKNRCSAGLLAVSLGAFGTLAIAPAHAVAMQDQNQTQDDGSFWTRFVPSEDTRLIFVSSSEGSDSNSGLTPDRPVKSLSRAYDLLRDGYPDWMLLKRGDVWYESFPRWSKSGRAEDEKLVVGAYGESSERPQIRPDSGVTALPGHGSDAVAHIAFVGFHLEPNNRTADQGGGGIGWLKESDDILFEDLYIDGFATNVNLQAFGGPDKPVRNIRFNGCVIVDAWNNNGHSQGLFAKGIDGLTIENSVFDHNGWNLTMGAEPTIFNHNIYIQNGLSDFNFTNNISSGASSHGIQMRGGGVATDNLFISNPLAMHIGGGDNPDPGGVTAVIKNNLVMHGRDIQDGMPRGFGISASNIREAIIDSNYLHLSNAGYNHQAIRLVGDAGLPTVNISISNNTILGWHGPFQISGPEYGQDTSNVLVERNTIYRDLRPDGPGESFNLPMMHLFDSWQDSVTLLDNKYLHYGMHNRPFKAGGSNLTADDWRPQVEPSAIILQQDNPPPTFDLDLYLQSIGHTGGWQDFIQLARSRSRTSHSEAFMAKPVIDWFVSNLDQHGLTQASPSE